MVSMDDPLFKAIAKASLRPITAFNLQCLGNTVWSFSKLDVHHYPLLYAISAASHRIISEFNPQGLSNTAWAFATLMIVHVPLLSALSAEFLRHINVIKPQNLTNTPWAYATLVLRDQPLLDSISEASRTSIESELSKWDCVEVSEECPADESIVTTALLWAFWESSQTPAEIHPLRCGPTNLLSIFRGD